MCNIITIWFYIDQTAYRLLYYEIEVSYVLVWFGSEHRLKRLLNWVWLWQLLQMIHNMYFIVLAASCKCCVNGFIIKEGETLRAKGLIMELYQLHIRCRSFRLPLFYVRRHLIQSNILFCLSVLFGTTLCTNTRSMGILVCSQLELVNKELSWIEQKPHTHTYRKIQACQICWQQCGMVYRVRVWVVQQLTSQLMMVF